MKIENWLAQKQGQVYHYKLEKVGYALELVGQPQQAIPTIHVAGTNGKGSTVAFLVQLLQEHGFKVGSFVSPHMVSVHDRICINHQPISEADFQRLAHQVYQLEQLVTQKYENFAYFEVMVLLMFLYFREQAPDIAIIEVGIGGLLDTTNVITPLVSVITSIGLDHQELLGQTLGAIAEQKAGIIKQGCPVVLGPVPYEAELAVRTIAQTKQASLYQFGQDFHWEANCFKNSQLSLPQLSLGLVGRHQEENASLALQAFCLLMDKWQLPIQDQGVRMALLQTRWRGRLEKVQEAPLIYLDGAHNVPAVERLSEFIRQQDDQEVTILFSALRRKDFHEMLEVLQRELPHARLLLTSFAYDGVLGMEDRLYLDYVPDYQAFLSQWRKTGRGTLYITGSLYFVSEVSQLFSTDH